MKCPYCGGELVKGNLFVPYFGCDFFPYNPDKKARFSLSDNGALTVVPMGFSRHPESCYCDQCHILITPNVGPKEWKRQEKKNKRKMN